MPSLRTAGAERSLAPGSDRGRESSELEGHVTPALPQTSAGEPLAEIMCGIRLGGRKAESDVGRCGPGCWHG